jgi:hypothetical protein
MYKTSCSWEEVLTFLCPFIWICVSGLMKFCDRFDNGAARVHQIFSKSQKKCDGLSMVTVGFMLMTLIKSNNLPNGKSKLIEIKKGKTCEEQR